MNLIEAWKRAKECQSIKRKNCPSRSYEKSNGYFQDIFNKTCEPDLLADDWEIVKEKKKVVIEGVQWHIDKSGIGVTYPLSYRNSADFKQLLDKPKMKMTLEYEE